MKKGKEYSKVWLAVGLLFVVVIVGAIATFIVASKKNEVPKKVTSISPELLVLKESYKEKLDVEEDSDGDGLKNREEEAFGTNPYSADSDHDGLSDSYEVKSSKTNPLKEDCDGDNLKDGEEVYAELDPLNPKTDGKTLDSQVTIEREHKVNDCILTVTGNAKIADVYADTFEIAGLNNMPGVISEVYEFYTKTVFKEATITIHYSDKVLEKKKTKEDNLRIYQFMEDKTFVEVKDCVIDKENNTVTAKLGHFSKYVLGDCERIGKTFDSKIMLLIDDSGSMYSKEVFNEEDGDENDPEFKRVDMAKELIKMSDDSMHYAVSSFTKDYFALGEFGESNKELLDKLESIRTNTKHNFNGTYIGESLMKAMEQFSEEDVLSRKFVVILTDGYSTEGSGLFELPKYSLGDIVNEAIDKDITIITIGLGANIDKDYLTEVAEKTSGRFLYASNANALQELYNTIMQAMQFDVADIDGDGVEQEIMIADSGFDVKENGFSFPNYNLNTPYGETGGQCFGFAAFSQLYYTGRIPMKMDEVGEQKVSVMHSTFPASGYDLNHVDFFTSTGDFAKSKNNLSTYHISSLDLLQEIRSMEVAKKYDYVNEERYLKYNVDIRSRIEENPFLQLGCKEWEKEQVYEDTYTYTKNDYVYMDITNVKEASLSEQQKQEYEFILAINRLFVRQAEEEFNEKEIKLPCADLAENIQIQNFNRIVGRINSGIPVIVSAENHSVNGIKIYRNFDDPCTYYFVLYDNNYPSEERLLRINKEKTGFAFDATKWVNDYIYTVYDIDGTFAKAENEIRIEVGVLDQ